ncbi:MAG: hypothetical protein ABI411_07805 [Tahibacter sp.]
MTVAATETMRSEALDVDTDHPEHARAEFSVFNARCCHFSRTSYALARFPYRDFRIHAKQRFAVLPT